MPICDLCGEESPQVTRCKTCGEKFCSDCGEQNTKQCVFCLEGDEDDDW